MGAVFNDPLYYNFSGRPVGRKSHICQSGSSGNETQSSQGSSTTKTQQVVIESSAAALPVAPFTSFPERSKAVPSSRNDMSKEERKAHPIFTGVLKYFPDALMEVAHLSKVGNDQHNPGEPLHWAKEKSTDEGDALVRHQLDAGTRDTDGERHSAKVAWRALAQLQREIEAEREAKESPR